MTKHDILGMSVEKKFQLQQMLEFTLMASLRVKLNQTISVTNLYNQEIQTGYLRGFRNLFSKEDVEHSSNEQDEQRKSFCKS